MRRIALLLGLTCLVGAAGCGGGSDSTSTTSATNRITSLTISPGAALVRTNGTRAFIYQIQGSGTPDPGVVWSASSGTIDNNGVYTANGGQSTATITVKSVFDSSKSASATVTVSDTLGPTFTVDTATRSSLSRHYVQIEPNRTVDLGALIKVVGVANTGIIWTVVTPNGGTIDANGVYASPRADGNYLIRYAAAADPTQFDYVYAVVAPLAAAPVTGTIAITPPQGVNGPLAVLKVGITYRFGYSLTLQNSNDPTVTWTVDNGASIGADGSFAAPHPGQYTVTVISRASGLSSSATVTAQ